jgi:hypothetical protein
MVVCVEEKRNTYTRRKEGNRVRGERYRARDERERERKKKEKLPFFHRKIFTINISWKNPSLCKLAFFETGF